ncbi:nitroreductase family protein [Metabacillus sp. SLBN-84]
MKNFIKKIISLKTRQKIKRLKVFILAQLIINFSIDLIKFIKYSSTFDTKKTRESHEASLIFYYHKIEKGLSLPKPRPGFGKEHVFYLVGLLEDYVKKYGWDDVSKVSLNTLNVYHDFNYRNNIEMKNLAERIRNLNAVLPTEGKLLTGGVEELKKEDICRKFIDFKDLVNSRYSIRNFADSEVSLEIIREAVEIAQKTPSVCNRQSARVHIYSDLKFKESVLNHQNGNAGFGDQASKIIIVTTKIESFNGAHERNQSYIDGGMYSMSLIYALHSLGVGTCPLNLSLNNSQEKNLKRVANISDKDALIMMIAVGNLPNSLKVAASHRRKAEEVITIH